LKTRFPWLLAGAAVLALAALLALPLPAADAPGVAFQDATAAAGIRFKHTSGAAGKKYLPETMGSGCAFLDYDNDGDQDILLVNAMEWTPGKGGAKSLPALYRNDGKGTFTDVTKEAGLAVETYGMGVAAADYDNDGWVDVFLTGLGRNRLFKNRGGTFVDVTDKAGVAGGGFSASAAFFDYDKDGKLDLVVTRYVEWTPEKDLFCTLDGKNKSYCTPESYKGASPILYHNRGDGTFEDVTAKAGLQSPASKGLGVAMLDYDGDGWLDLVIANDTQPNKLYHNNKNGTFTDTAMTAGIAFSEAGVARAGMGVDAADYDGSGRPSLVIGNFSNEMMALYHNEGSGLFVDQAPGSTIGQATALTLTFACFFFDYDLDGQLDIFAANGHVADDINRVQAKVQYAQPPHVFRNLGGGKFEAATPRLGAALQRPMVARGAAYGDFDGDGDLDVLLNVNNGPAVLLRNDGGNRNHYLRVRTVGTTSNRDGIGARVTVTLDGGRRLEGMVRTGSSYLSQSELPLTFGLGGATKVAKVEVAWPSGKTDVATGVTGDRVIVIKEGQAVVPDAGTASKKTGGD
jgi:enediyne biosynthesis protein E4